MCSSKLAYTLRGGRLSSTNFESKKAAYPPGVFLAAHVSGHILLHRLGPVLKVPKSVASSLLRGQGAVTSDLSVPAVAREDLLSGSFSVLSVLWAVPWSGLLNLAIPLVSRVPNLKGLDQKPRTRQQKGV